MASMNYTLPDGKITILFKRQNMKKCQGGGFTYEECMEIIKEFAQNQG